MIDIKALTNDIASMNPKKQDELFELFFELISIRLLKKVSSKRALNAKDFSDTDFIFNINKLVTETGNGSEQLIMSAYEDFRKMFYGNK